MAFIPVRVRFILGIVAGLVTLAIIQIIENKKKKEDQLSSSLRFGVSAASGVAIGLLSGFISELVDGNTDSSDLSVSSYSGTVTDATGNTTGAVIVDANVPKLNSK